MKELIYFIVKNKFHYGLSEPVPSELKEIIDKVETIDDLVNIHDWLQSNMRTTKLSVQNLESKISNQISEYLKTIKKISKGKYEKKG